MAEPFTQLLNELVRTVDGAVGAAFIDSYGEAVQCVSANGDDDYVKLMGAYQGISLGTSRTIASQLEAGEIDYCFTAYENASFLVKALDNDYFLLLVLSPDANVGKGVYDVRKVADAFNKEM